MIIKLIKIIKKQSSCGGFASMYLHRYIDVMTRGPCERRELAGIDDDRNAKSWDQTSNKCVQWCQKKM